MVLILCSAGIIRKGESCQVKFKINIVKDKQFYLKVLAIMLPVAAQQAINMGVNMMDTIMLGQLGEVQLSASSLANSFYNIFQIFCMGTIGGCSVVASHYYGAGENRKVQEVFSLALRIISVLAIVFALVTWFFPAQIMRIYTPDQPVIDAGVGYLRITAFIYLIHGTGFVTAQLMRSVNQPRIGLYVSLLSFFVNVGANWIFIFGHFGAPRMEIRGAALGTLIARAAEFIATFALVFGQKKFRFRLRDFFINPTKEIVTKYVKVGMPALISDALLGFGNTALSMIIGRLGVAAVSANSICQVVDRFFTVIVSGIANASSIIVGHTIGSGKKEEAQAQGETFYLLSVIFGIISGAILFLIGPLTLKLYKLEPETVVVAKQMMNAFAVIVFFQAVQSVMTKGVLRGGGDTRFLMIADILFLWVVSIPFGYLAGIILHWPAWLVQVCLRADYVIKSVWCIGRLMSGKWIHDVARKK